MKEAGVEVQRELGTDVQFQTKADKVVINVDLSAVKAGVGNIKVETPNCAVTLPTDAMKKNRENLVVKRYDQTFTPLDTMTRGDVAIILYRLFKKLW